MMEKLFIDSNIFLAYLFRKPGWIKIAEILNTANIEIYTHYLVLNEVKFKLLYEIASRKLQTTKKFEIIKKIKKDQQIREEVYESYLRFYLSIRRRAQVLESDEEIESSSIVLSMSYGMLPTDATILASMKKYGINKILTDDKDFKRIKGISAINM